MRRLLTELFAALTRLLKPLNMPLYLADCLPRQTPLPYAAVSVDPPGAEGPGRIELTGWVHSASAHQERLAWGDALLTCIPAQGLALRLEHSDVLLLRAKNVPIACEHGADALGLTIPLDLYVYEHPAPDCALNGVSLSGLDERIRILSIEEAAPALDVQTVPAPYGGSHLFSRTREKLDVTVRFLILAGTRAERLHALSLISGWANGGGLLTHTARAGQQLHVAATRLPTLPGDDPAREMALTLTAFASPWWETEQAFSVTTGDSAALAIPGTAEITPVDVTLTNTGSAAITAITLTTPLSRMDFAGLSLPAGGVFTLKTENGVLSAKIGQTGVMMHRTPDSDDLLLAPCGSMSGVSVTTDGTASAVFSARGRFA